MWPNGHYVAGEKLISKLPGVSHHEVKVRIAVNGCTHTSVVVKKLLTSYLEIGKAKAKI